MLPTNLTTNEVKTANGSELEFARQSVSERKLVFSAVIAAPSAPHTITVQHQVVGKGVLARRRSNIRIDRVVNGSISSTPRTVTASFTIDIPVGDLDTLSIPTDVMAEMISFVASLGASTTILYDGTGNGAASLLNGTL